MNIKTKFNVGDIVKSEYDRNTEERVSALRIMEIFIQRCYAATQIFYLCRPIVATRHTKGYARPMEYEWAVFHGIGERDNELGWKKYREDELILPDKEALEIITGNEK